MAVLIRTFSSGILAGKRRNINLILDVTPYKEITWGCIWSVLCMTPTITFNNPLFLIISSSALLRMRNDQTKVVEKIKKHVLRSVTFPKCVVYEIRWKKYHRARPATDDNNNTAHAHCILDTYGYKHTLRIYNTNCLFHHNGYTNAPQCYVIRTLLVLLRLAPISYAVPCSETHRLAGTTLVGSHYTRSCSRTNCNDVFVLLGFYAALVVFRRFGADYRMFMFLTHPVSCRVAQSV